MTEPLRKVFAEVERSGELNEEPALRIHKPPLAETGKSHQKRYTQGNTFIEHELEKRT